MAGLVCSEFDEFAEALQGVDGRYLLTARAACDWQLNVAELPGVSLMRGQDGAANLFQAACRADVNSLFVPIGSACGLTVNGIRMESGSAAWLRPGGEFHMRVRGPQRWLAVMIESNWIRPADPWIQDARSFLPQHTHIGPASRAAISNLMALARRIFQTGDQLPPEAKRSRPLGDALIELSLQVASSLQPERTKRRGRPAAARKLVLERSLDVIESELGQMIQLADLSRATGVSERTLHAVFQKQFGLSPHQYIIARRLQGIHAAILNASPHETVSEICGRFGAWDFGRVARAYKARFGTTPSAMLARHRYTS